MKHFIFSTLLAMAFFISPAPAEAHKIHNKHHGHGYYKQVKNPHYYKGYYAGHRYKHRAPYAFKHFKKHKRYHKHNHHKVHDYRHDYRHDYKHVYKHAHGKKHRRDDNVTLFKIIIK